MSIRRWCVGALAVLLFVPPGQAIGAVPEERFVYKYGPDRNFWVGGGDEAEKVTSFSILERRDRPAISADATTLAYECDDAGRNLQQICTLDIDSREETVEFSAEGGELGNPSFAPDGESLVIERSRLTESQFDLYEIELGSADARNITNTEDVDETDPDFMPNGMLVAVAVNRNRWNESELRRIHPGTGAAEILWEYANDDGALADPTVSPNGHDILFMLHEGGESGAWNIYHVNIDDQSPRERLFLEESEEWDPTWWAPWSPSYSQDGRSVIYTGSGGALFEVDAEGKNKRKLRDSAISPDFNQVQKKGELPDSPTDADLLRRYRPFLRYSRGEGFPFISAAAATDTPGNTLRWIGRIPILRRTAAGGGLSLQSLNPTSYPGFPDLPVTEDDSVDFRGTQLELFSASLAWFLRPGTRNVAYGRVVDGGGGGKWLQYWFFAYYNPVTMWRANLGAHEGDWEGISIEVGEDSLPRRATYNQHGSRETCDWWSGVEKRGGQPVVYVARNSHASYFKPGTYETDVDPLTPKDVAAGNGNRGDSRVHVLTSSDHWQSWPGRWGGTAQTYPTLPFADSPRWGPKAGDGSGEVWSEPWTWAAGAKMCPSGRATASASSPRKAGPRPPSLRLRAWRKGEREVLVRYSMPGRAARRLNSLILTVEPANGGGPAIAYEHIPVRAAHGKGVLRTGVPTQGNLRVIGVAVGSDGDMTREVAASIVG